MKNLIITLATIFTVALFVWAFYRSIPKILDIYKTDGIETKIDTVITEKRDTIILTNVKPYTEIKYKTVRDTFYTDKYDTVVVDVPLSVQKYEADTLSTDGTKVHYRASISGYRQSLDTLWFDVAHNEKTITKEIIKYKRNRGFKIAPYVGYGYGLNSKQFEPSVGICVAYNF